MHARVKCCAGLRLVVPSCLTLCDPMDYSPPGSSVHGILQTRILEWVAMPSSRGSFQLRDQAQVSRIAGGFFTIWVTREVQKYWSGYPIPSPGHLPNPGVTPASLTSPALAGGFFTTSAAWEVQSHLRTLQNIKKPLGLVLSPFLFFNWNPKTEICKWLFYWLLLMWIDLSFSTVGYLLMLWNL